MAGDFPLHPLQLVAQLPECVAEGLRLVLGAAGVLAELGAVIRQLPSPRGQLLGLLSSGAALFCRRLGALPELLVPLLEPFPIQCQLSQSVGQPVALTLQIAETVSTAREGGDRTQQILSLKGRGLFGLGAACIGFLVRLISPGNTVADRGELCFEGLGPLARLDDAAVERPSTRDEGGGFVASMVERSSEILEKVRRAFEEGLETLSGSKKLCHFVPGAIRFGPRCLELLTSSAEICV